eukprot:scaffold25_cov342-Pavlova_lutheri.AAC.7
MAQERHSPSVTSNRGRFTEHRPPIGLEGPEVSIGYDALAIFAASSYLKTKHAFSHSSSTYATAVLGILVPRPRTEILVLFFASPGNGAGESPPCLCLKQERWNDHGNHPVFFSATGLFVCSGAFSPFAQGGTVRVRCPHVPGRFHPRAPVHLLWHVSRLCF